VRLADFILANVEPILVQWESFVKDDAYLALLAGFQVHVAKPSTRTL
jgi:hypothetical protein